MVTFLHPERLGSSSLGSVGFSVAPGASDDWLFSPLSLLHPCLAHSHKSPVVAREGTAGDEHP